jgi:hypothetical protein
MRPVSFCGRSLRLKTSGKREQKNRQGASGTGTVTVGWKGVTLRAPEGWSPVSVSGEGEHGYLKVVSPDTRYLEVKWEKPRGVVSVPAALERYFDRLRRSARKMRQEIRIRENAGGLAAVRPRSQAPISYTWQADRKAFGCIWHCGACGRLVIAELVGEPGDDLSAAAEIFRELSDHSEDGWNTWALYGLTVPAPAAYEMEKQVLMTGHQRFSLRNRGETIHADRWGLAEIALRGTTLQEWFESRESGALQRYAYQVRQTELHGHPALRLTGRDRLAFALFKLLRVPATLVWPRFFFRGYAWHCPQSNRIYSVVGEQPRRGLVIDEVVERICCHAGPVSG